MRRVAALLVCVCICACGGRKETAAPDVGVATTVAPAPAPAPPDAAGSVEHAAVLRPAAGRARLQLTLRSTPAGATASVDGRTLGSTPMIWDIDDDGRAHSFTFTLGGYAPWRLRFAPTRDGVIHAALRPIEERDGGLLR